MQPLLRERLTEQLEQLRSIDPVAKSLQQMTRRLVPDGTTVKDFLSGTWLGHPLHPVLTDVVIGSWTSVFFLDLVPTPSTRRASDRLLGIGILAAAPTAAAGLSDFAELGPGLRRVGALHAVGNVTALSLMTLAWLRRKRGKRASGWLLAMAGNGVATASAYLGGHLSFGKGVGVNQTAFEELPRAWTAVMDASDLGERTLARGRAGTADVLLYRTGEQVAAMVDRCSHRGCSLSQGEVDGGDVICPCHGSRFRLEDGSVVHGPATAPQARLEARIQDGKVEIRRPREESVRPLPSAVA